MAAVWMRAKNDLRARWRGALVLAVLIGLAAGVAMTAAAGARRTATSYERLLRESKAYDLEVQNVGDAEPEILDRVGALPQVDEYSRVVFVPATKATDGPPSPFAWDVTVLAMADRNLGRTIEIPRVIAGRMPNLDAADEAVVNEAFAETHDVGVGDEYPLQMITLDELFRLFGGRSPVPTGPVATVRIVGIWRVPHDVAIGEREGFLATPPAFFETYGDRIATLWVSFVRLKPGAANSKAFLAAARKIGDESELSIVTQADSIAKVDRALTVQTSALWILAVVVAAGAAVILGQALGRWIRIGADEQPTLRALGMSPGQGAGAGAIAAGAIGLGAAIIAVLSATLGSPLVPVGFARRIDPELGVFADVPVLALGAAAAFAFVVIRSWIQGALIARLRTEPAAASSRPSTIADRLARGGFPPPVVAGVRFALEPGRGRTAVPVRSVLIGASLSIVAVVGAFLFGRSMELMISTPATHGFNWDVVGFGGEDPELAAEIQGRLAELESVSEFSRVVIRSTTFDDDEIGTIGVTPVKGSVLPTVLEGRYPNADDEVALGTKTLRSAGLAIGDTAAFPGSAEACGGTEGCDIRFRIVGRIAFWAEDADPDDGAGFTEAGLNRLRGSGGFTDFVIRIAPRTDRDAALADITQASGDATLSELPTSIANLARVRSMPSVLGGILAALALATLVHALVTCVRRRAGDLAILKTLGLVRRQVMAAVAWQATTLIIVSLVVGIPLGILAGRYSWRLLADRIGVLDVHAVAWAALAVGTAGVILLGNLVSAFPGRAAARVHPATVLRAE